MIYNYIVYVNNLNLVRIIEKLKRTINHLKKEFEWLASKSPSHSSISHLNTHPKCILLKNQCELFSRTRTILEAKEKPILIIEKKNQNVPYYKIC